MRSTEAHLARGAAAGAAPAGPVLLFDGVCNLCNAAVRFVMERDPAGTVRFASIQSEAGGALLAGLPHPPPRSTDGSPATLVLVENGEVYTRSDAALRVAGHMRAPWPWLRAAQAVPRWLRDRVYDFVSRRRYRWFGTTGACRLPSAEEATRFLT